jgi:hypothetical protein
MEKPPSFLQLLEKSGKYSLVIVIFALAFQYWGVIQLEKIPIPHLVDILYVYLILSGSSATPFIYLERKKKVVPGKFCPACGSPLEMYPTYKCPKCGKLEYKKES